MAKNTAATKTKKDLGAEKKAERAQANAALATLSGKTLSQMTQKEKDQFLTALGQLMGIIDINGAIK